MDRQKFLDALLIILGITLFVVGLQQLACHDLDAAVYLITVFGGLLLVRIGMR
jgi:hypothetical protein